MQTNTNPDVLKKITYLIGSAEIIANLPFVPAMAPFEDSVIDFLNDVSGCILKNKSARAYSDVITFGFWIRKGSTLALKNRFMDNNVHFRLGKGVVFHIAPSNVPVNFAYSLVSGLLTGNSNIVRVPSKEFTQVKILVDSINQALEKHISMKQYILCVRYEREKEINDLFSSIADMRVVWGGDHTIAELRKSELAPRSGEITFADRYSLAVIDSDTYMAIENKSRVAEDFYNDTYFSDQNACTSPKIVVWTGNRIEEAKVTFWKEEHSLVEKKYSFQPIQSVNKLSKSFSIAANIPGVKIESRPDNLIVRITVPEISRELMNYQDNSGYFYEYDCKNILDIRQICDDKRCQTISYIGDKNIFRPLIQSGIKGIDRIVPIGKTMDFDLIWDGYNLPVLLSRIITI